MVGATGTSGGCRAPGGSGGRSKVWSMLSSWAVPGGRRAVGGTRKRGGSGGGSDRRRTTYRNPGGLEPVGFTSSVSLLCPQKPVWVDEDGGGGPPRVVQLPSGVP